ncbi:MAG: hypothetical protein JW891_14930 [Candidatus Lokiarchaeota archaeon]|nr:hypothetical protein [Candidatus Lokiarchaeota archaeon]
MLIGAALQELKTLKSKLARLYILRRDTFNVLENKIIEVEFEKVTEDIRNLLEEIKKLKGNIAKTNAKTIIELDGIQITMQELIITIGDLKSELYQLEYLKPRGAVYLGGQAVEYIPQKRQDEMATIIANLEEKKAELDKILQSKNWQIELVD